MKIFFIRSPRYTWPHIGDKENFIQPLGYCALAAYLREANISGVTDIKIIDCAALKIGWKSLVGILKKTKPDVVCFGEETCYLNEGLKLCNIIKKINPNCITIGGGYHLTYYPEDIIGNLIDFVVRFEGERALVELIKEVLKNKKEQNFSKIKGIAYKKKLRMKEVLVKTPCRKPIKNLDSLPFPAYDLLDMDRYIKSKMWPNLGVVEHSRGCIGNCKFCCLWQSSDKSKTGLWRTKSAKRTVDEIEFLVKKYNKKTIWFVDNTFNVNAKWNLDFANEILRRKIKIKFFAFMRADFIVRDAKTGTLKKLVDAGLFQPLIGIESHKIKTLKKFRKKNYSPDITKQAVYELRKLKKCFIVGTFIMGTEDEKYEDLIDMIKYCMDIKIDMVYPLVISPFPGTENWKHYKKENIIEIKDYRYYDFYTPVVPTKYMSRQEIKNAMKDIMKMWFSRPKYILNGYFHKVKSVRIMYRHHLNQAFKIPLY